MFTSISQGREIIGLCIRGSRFRGTPVHAILVARTPVASRLSRISISMLSRRCITRRHILLRHVDDIDWHELHFVEFHSLYTPEQSFDCQRNGLLRC